MPDRPVSVVIDCSRAILPDAAIVDRIEADALELVRAGELDKAKRVLDSVDEIRRLKETPAETLVELTDEEIAQREADRESANEVALATLRVQRNARLTASDWTQTASDAPLSDADRKAWAEYRQALRDWPASIDDPLDPPPWPDQPTGG